MLYTNVRDEPYFVPKNYKREFKEPCKPDEDNDYDQEYYRGSGISPEEHPENGRINFSTCGNCGSTNVLVLYTQWSVSVHSGDCYWDYEIVCNDCGKFTTQSYSEND